MKRPLTPKGKESRKKILQAAEMLFATKGFQVATVSEIVAAAGLTQAAFYLYFDSKQQLFEELTGRFQQQLLALSDAGKKVTHTPSGQIPSQITDNLVQLFNLFAENPYLTKIALEQSPDSDELRNRIVMMIRNNMAANQRAGIVHPEIDTHIAAESIVAMMVRLVERFLLSGEETAVELAKKSARLIMYGLLTEDYRKGEKSCSSS